MMAYKLLRNIESKKKTKQNFFRNTQRKNYNDEKLLVEQFFCFREP